MASYQGNEDGHKGTEIYKSVVLGLLTHTRAGAPAIPFAGKVRMVQTSIR